MKIVLSDGLEGLHMTSLATAADISRQLLYSYFRNREEVIDALFDRTFNEVILNAASTPARTGNFEADFATVSERLLALPSDLAEIVSSAYFGDLHPAQRQVKKKIRERLQTQWIAELGLTWD
jgi:AcrR family transcriptional regulator